MFQNKSLAVFLDKLAVFHPEDMRPWLTRPLMHTNADFIILPPKSENETFHIMASNGDPVGEEVFFS